MILTQLAKSTHSRRLLVVDRWKEREELRVLCGTAFSVRNRHLQWLESWVSYAMLMNRHRVRIVSEEGDEGGRGGGFCRLPFRLANKGTSLSRTAGPRTCSQTKQSPSLALGKRSKDLRKKKKIKNPETPRNHLAAKSKMLFKHVENIVHKYQKIKRNFLRLKRQKIVCLETGKISENNQSCTTAWVKRSERFKETGKSEALFWTFVGDKMIRFSDEVMSYRLSNIQTTKASRENNFFRNLVSIYSKH